MRFVYAADLHGNIPLYEQLISLAEMENAEVLILGGDLFKYTPDTKVQLQFADEYLRGFFSRLGIPSYILPGNTDRPGAVKLLSEINGLVNNLSLESSMVSDSIRIIGYPYITPSPFKIKDYDRRDLAADDIIFDIPCTCSPTMIITLLWYQVISSMKLQAWKMI